MQTVARIVLGIIGLVGIGILAISSASILRFRTNDLVLLVIETVVLFPISFLALWFAGSGHIPEERRRMAFTLMAGVIVGSIAFGAGFFGPIVLDPGGNQGPLFGIFISGPVGFFIGCAGGFIWARRRG
jgi:hypothetical protein